MASGMLSSRQACTTVGVAAAASSSLPHISSCSSRALLGPTKGVSSREQRLSARTQTMAEVSGARSLLITSGSTSSSSNSGIGRTRRGNGWWKKDRHSKQGHCGCIRCSKMWGELGGRRGGLTCIILGYRSSSRRSRVSIIMANLVNDVVGNLPSWNGTLQQTVQQLSSQDTGGLIQLGSNAIISFSELPDGERWKLVSGSAFGWLYLTARPGVLTGAVDTFVWAPLQFVVDGALGRRSWKRTDFLVGERLGEGSFGTVYAGFVLPRKLTTEDDEFGRRGRRIEEYAGYKSFEKVILKKVKVGVQGADECGEMEEWFNYRMNRAAPDACAKYLGSFRADATRGQFTQGGKWLVWKYEGDSTLLDFMKQRNFPENLERPLFGRTLKSKDQLQRSSLIIKQIMRQIISSLNKMHATGIVHRDVKPSNLVVTNKGKLKFIDFGAATDLRVGKNYVPERGMLDPDYCPPELYVLPEETPNPPPAPVAAALSPFIWQFNSPDLFDMYSAGVILLQMASSGLRTPLGLQIFKKEIAEVGYDLKKWRGITKVRTNFEVLDHDGGKGWDLVTKLICERGMLRRGRLSAAAALRHPYFLLGGDQASSVLSKLTLSK